MLYQTGTTCFLAGGSTLGIQTMLACTCSPGDTVIAARNAHKAFINTCALLDLRVRWILPDCRDSFGVSGTVTPEQVEAALSKGCLLYTSLFILTSFPPFIRRILRQ